MWTYAWFAWSTKLIASDNHRTRTASYLIIVHSSFTCKLTGLSSVRRADDALARTKRVAAENEEIGVEVLGELGTQREALQRTDGKLDATNAELSKSRKLLNTMHRRSVGPSGYVLPVGCELYVPHAVPHAHFVCNVGYRNYTKLCQ